MFGDHVYLKMEVPAELQSLLPRGWHDITEGAAAFPGMELINIEGILEMGNIAPQDISNQIPAWSIVTYQFPANAWRPAVKMVWYDGGKTAPAELCEGETIEKSGSLIVGDKGKLWGGGKLLKGAEPKDVKFPESPGHFEEWVRAIRGGEPAMSNFPDYAGPLTEVVLLGNLAVWAADRGKGPKIEWDAVNLKAKNAQGLEKLIKPTYRKGYSLEG